MSLSVDPLASLHNPSVTNSRLASVNNSGVTKDQFLQLFVAELRHQDPLDPQKGADFVAQLAQFSSLEAAADTNSHLSDIASGQLAAQRASLANFIGKTVTSRTDTVTLNGQGAPSLVGHLDGLAAKGQVVVTSSDGTVVRTLPLAGGVTGDFAINWDGKDDKGRALAAGDYHVEVQATTAGGAALSGYMQIKGVVSGLEFAADGPRFRVGGASLSPADISSVNG